MRSILSTSLLFASGAVFSASPWQLAEPLSNQRAQAFNPAATATVRVDVQPDAFDADSEEVTLPLPDGSSVTAARVSSERRGATHYTWVGHVDGDPDQQVSLTRVGNELAGYLSIDQGIFELTPSAHGTLLLELDSSRFPECGGALPSLPQSEAASVPASAVVGGDDPNLIDVLVVFSPGSAAQIGDAAARQTFAQSAVDSANLAFQNSQMVARLRLAGVQTTTRPDAGASSDLSWLSSNSEVAGWRNAAAADLVGMVSEFSGSCGLGFLMGSPPSVGFAGSGFQVTSRACAVGNLSYAHEHGHNMGFHHNPEDGGGEPSFPYAFGHYINGNYRTVMSYSSQCGSGCTRHPYFSNPNVTFNGVATGVADQRDNARAGNQTASIVALFRAPWGFANGFE
jgi:hypothetical protein